MSTVEDRVVGMKFDNKQFEPAVKTSLGTLDKLKAALSFKGADRGLTDLQNKANRFTLGGLSNATQGISGKFLAMSTVAVTALANIVNRAVDAGVKIANALTLAPLKDGFREYELQLGSVQTILANTQASGATLKDVNATLDELNKYSDDTIYNFGEMARNIGTFTAAGVDLERSTAAIKGIANLAALSGSNSQQASTAMYQLSQAISAGRVGLQDWNSVVNAGMGGAVFQRALAQTAERMGTLEKGSVKLSGKMKNATINGKSFRESITAKPGEQSWLTADVLTNTLSQFTGDMKDAELASMGFSEAQIRSIQDQAKMANDAATQVKTFTQLIGTLQESAGSGYAQTFEILVGDFEEAKALFTDVSDVLGSFISDSATARNEMLQAWKDLGGRKALIESFANIFNTIVRVAKPISQAFRDIFPRTTGKQLYDMTVRFLEFTRNLKIGDGTLDLIRRTARGFFAILSIGVSIVKGVLRVIGDLFGYLSSNSGGFLETTAEVGDFLVKLDETIKKGDLVTKFFERFGEVVQNPIGALRDLGKAIEDFFANLSGNPFEDLGAYLGRFKDRLEPLAAAADKVAGAWDKLREVFKKVADFVSPAVDAIKDAFSGIGQALADAFSAGDFSSVYDALNTGLLAGIVLLIKKMLGKNLSIDFGGGFLSGITDSFEALTGVLSAMQAQVESKTLLTIAAAVAILTASVVILSMIDSKKLTKAMTGIAAGLGLLMGSLKLLATISGSAGYVKIPALAASLILLATAVLILSAALKMLSGLDWEELGKGLVGVAALLGMLVPASAGLDKSSGSMLRAGLAMIPLAIGIRILAGAVSKFAEMSWGDIAKGLTGVAGALLIIVGAMQIMPKNMLAQAAALVLIAGAINAIGLAVKVMGGMSPAEIAKGLITLAGSLAVLAGGLYLMTAALPGAAALIVAAGALAILTPVLVALGSLSWGAIAKGLVAIAGSFAVLGLAAYVLAPIIPLILGLGIALALIGGAFALVGVGAMALATAFSIFAAAGAGALSFFAGAIKLIPEFMKQFAVGVGEFIRSLVEQSDSIVKALASLLGSLFTALISLIPQLGDTISTLIKTLCDIILRNAPLLIQTGISLIKMLLGAVRDNAAEMITLAADIVVNFVNGIGNNAARVVKAGANLIIKLMDAISREIPRVADRGAKAVIRLVDGIADAIRRNSSEMNRAGRNLGNAILEGMVSGIRSGIGWVASWARYAASAALNAAKSFLGINSPSKEFMKLGRWSDEGLAEGLKNNADMVGDAGTLVGASALDSVRSSLALVGDALVNTNDFNPTITPVLDLSNVVQESGKIGGLFGNQKISADLSYGQAVGIARERVDISEAAAAVEASKVTTNNFTQNNYSPTSLSTGEIYRNTKSQFAMAKEATERS